MSAHLMAEPHLVVRRGSSRRDALPGPTLLALLQRHSLQPQIGMAAQETSASVPHNLNNNGGTPPVENPIGWAMFNPLPLKPKTLLQKRA
ncbi:unnamed protein product, partial [Mesorhabditis spiculigera]